MFTHITSDMKYLLFLNTNDSTDSRMYQWNDTKHLYPSTYRTTLTSLLAGITMLTREQMALLFQRV